MKRVRYQNKLFQKILIKKYDQRPDRLWGGYDKKEPSMRHAAEIEKGEMGIAVDGYKISFDRFLRKISILSNFLLRS